MEKGVMEDLSKSNDLFTCLLQNIMFIISSIQTDPFFYTYYYPMFRILFHLSLAMVL